MADLSDLVKTLNDLSAKMAKMPGFSALAKDMDKASKSAKNFNKTLKAAKGTTSLFDDQVGELRQSLRETADQAQKIHFEKGMDSKKLSEFIDKHKKLSKELEGLSKISSKTWNPAKIKEYMEKIKETQAKITKLRLEEEVSSKTRLGAIDDMAGGFGKFGSSMKKWSSGNRGAMKEAGDDIKGLGKNWSTLGGQLMGKKGFVGGVGAAMKGLGPIMEGLGAKLAGPAGIAYSVVKGIYDIGTAMDQFVKDINKSFAMVRGPDITTANVKKQFQDFNNMIFNTAENIRVGLDAKQVTGFIDAINQAGMNISQLNTGLYDYRDAIYIAAKASRTLGVDLPYVASLMEDMMMNFRMNMDQVDRAFVQVAFDAKKSGLSTDRFWTAVKNATASLSMYGVFIESTSKMMEKFSKTGIKGTQETAQTVEELTQSFHKMNTSQRAAFVGLIRGARGGMDIMKDMAGKIRKDLEEQAGQVQAEIAATLEMKESKKKELAKSPGDQAIIADLEQIDNSLDNLNTRNTGLQSKILMATEAQAAKNEVALSPYLELFSDKAGQLVGQLLKANIKGIPSLMKLSGENVILAQQILEANGLSASLAMDLKNLTEAQYKKTTDSLKQLKKIKGLNLKGDESSEKIVDALIKDRTITEDQASDLGDLMKISDASRKNIIALLGASDDQKDAIVQKIDDDIVSQGLADKMILGTDKASKVVMDKQKAQAEKTFKSIVGQTLSFKEMQKIAEDEIKWRGATLGIFKFMGEGVSDILRFLIQGKSFQTTEQKLAEEQVRATVKTMKKTAYLAATQEKILKGRALSKSDQDYQNIAEAAYDELKSVNSNLQGLNKIDDIADGIEEPSKKLDNLAAIKTTSEEQSKYLETLKKGLNKEMTSEDFERQLNINKKSAREQRGILEKQKNKMEELISNTGKMEDNLQKLVDEAILSKIDPATQAKMLRDIKSGKPEELLEKRYGKAAVEAYKRQHPEIIAQGLRHPLTIDKPAMTATLHKGETILPRPGLITGGVNAPAAGPAQKNITISVNANERDLAQRIANEVRSVLYREQLTGMT